MYLCSEVIKSQVFLYVDSDPHRLVFRPTMCKMNPQGAEKYGGARRVG
jgi:hypothetical protein